MIVDKYLSSKLYFFSFLLVIFVVLIHTYNIGNRFIGLDPDMLNFTIQNFLSRGVASVAVPFFFIMSGFFFFKNGKNFSMFDYTSNLTKRIHSLLIPYLLVSGLVLLFFYTIQSIDVLKPVFNKDLITDKSIGQLIYCWLVQPVAYQLWYVRNLILVCIISPFIFYLIQKAGYIYILIVLLGWLFFSDSISGNILPTLTFFSIGAAIAIKNIRIPDYRNKVPWLLMPVVLLWLCLAYLGSVVVIDIKMLLNISIILGIVTLWVLYDFLYQINSRIFKIRYAKYAFFIFMFHEPLLTIIIKLLIIMKLNSAEMSLMVYFTSFFTTVFLCIAMGIIFEKITPGIYKIVMGNR